MQPIEQARLALDGLSVGDGFGDLLPARLETTQDYISQRKFPPSPWRWTDDTNMALSIYEVLRKHSEINQDALALSFAKHYDVTRGYGPGVHRKLRRINAGEHWRDVIADEFKSYGNGGAMRVAPVGAYFADDLDKVTEQARLSSEVTHAHHEGIAGSIAIAVATAYAWQLHGKPPPTRSEFLDGILKYVPHGEVYDSIETARNFAPDVSVRFAAEVLGNGKMITAQDTVAFTLWCAAGNLTNFEDAMWVTISQSGDPDTNCAVVGGIVSLYTGKVPQLWVSSREPLPEWSLTG